MLLGRPETDGLGPPLAARCGPAGPMPCPVPGWSRSPDYLDGVDASCVIPTGPGGRRFGAGSGRCRGRGFLFSRPPRSARH